MTAARSALVREAPTGIGGGARARRSASAASQIRVHVAKEPRVRTAGRQRDPHLAHSDAEPPAELEQRQPNRVALRRRQARARQSEPPERGEQRLGDRREGEPQLIRAQRVRARAIGKVDLTRFRGHPTRPKFGAEAAHGIEEVCWAT
jgi:hypothetical protein